MSKLKLAAPWTIYYRQMQALFNKDKDVRVIFDEDTPAVNIYVGNNTKAAALTKLLPEKQTFGNIVLKINVVPGNEGAQSSLGLIQDALYGNEAVVDIVPVTGVFTNPLLYVIFAKEVVQFFNDDLSDAHGICSTLYQDLAKEILGQLPGVYFCTDVDKDTLGKTLGEWP